METSEIIEPKQVEESDGSPEAAIADTDESGSTSQSDATLDESSDLSDVYYEIDGEEVSAADIKRWKSGHLMQSDYTRKTQQLAEERKRVTAEREQLSGKLETLQSVESELQKLILADFANVDMEELRKYDTPEFLRVKALQEERAKTLKTLSEKAAGARNELANQGFKQLSEKLGWEDKAKQEADTKQILEYAKDAGISQSEFGKIVDPGVMMAILEAAKYRKLKAENPTQAKRVMKPVKVTKPSVSQAQAPKALSLAERMYGKTKTQ